MASPVRKANRAICAVSTLSFRVIFFSSFVLGKLFILFKPLIYNIGTGQVPVTPYTSPNSYREDKYRVDCDEDFKWFHVIRPSV